LNLNLEDYLYNDWENKYDAIICNPPYFKFHDYENKNTLKEIQNRLGIKLSGFTNIYTLFLLKSIFQLNDGGRAAYIIPSEFLNSDYGVYVKKYLLETGVLKQLILFDFKENVFEDALTTSAILLLEKSDSCNSIQICKISNLQELSEYPHLKFTEIKSKSLDPNKKWRSYFTESTSTGFTNLVPFRQFAKVVRGIATGANEYFMFCKSKANKLNVSSQNLVPCITRSKDVTENIFTKTHYEKLVNSDSNIFLLDATIPPHSTTIENYIEYGIKNGIDKKYLTSKRNPWYALENRPPSPIWVGVFNRNGLKFVRNEAMIRNLTTFHCVYPIQNIFGTPDIDLLFAYLLTDIAHQIFDENRREYGDGLKKFEPNDLNNAMVLDLTKLSEKGKNTILELYNRYRDTVLSLSTDESIISDINDIFLEEFSIK
jgi:adenine-specific DNA-methyltransferase